MTASAGFIRLLNAKVDIYHNAKICGNWQINAHHVGRTCFHVVTEGMCLLALPGQADCALRTGDLVLFPKEIEHTLMPVDPLAGEQQHLPYVQAQHLEGTGLLCASVQLNHGAGRYLLDAIPEVLIIRNNSANAWLSPLTELLRIEHYQQGPLGDVVIQRLCELMFTYAMANCIEDSTVQTGLLALYAHPRLSAAIQAMHDHPAKSWSLEALAQQAAMSRTAFATAFKELSGWTPMQYLTWWRMQLAWHLLADGEPVAIVADKIGYQSEAAFSRAFKSEFKQTAGEVRRGARN
ncbi:AraC family transcriptional regulator [Saccharophagus degradans]|uniref:AraC family transcriptional regulator n=1 Tax=Saccharophagus degradans TaxID=86304 RepID=UPI001C082FC2|nr:AraC family transcriptional regulator [Saccharophagus degradans]MBU2985006.1 AraC family transcriptional regulator [Saccharophagus degradans]